MSRLYGPVHRALQDRFDTRRLADNVEARVVSPKSRPSIRRSLKAATCSFCRFFVTARAMYTDIRRYNRQNLCLVRRAKRLWRPGSASMIYRPPYRRRIVLASNAKAIRSRERSMKNTSATLRVARLKARGRRGRRYQTLRATTDEIIEQGYLSRTT
jgi:hypothetical protein